MTNPSELHRELMERATGAAKRAGGRIMSYYGQDLDIFSKGIDSHTGDCVTRADHEAQDLIFDHLLNQFEDDPLLRDCAVLSEEMIDYHQSERFDKTYTFLIDPLDGTRGFLDHNNSFGVSIGLIQQDNTPVFGVVLLPAFGKLFSGYYNYQAWMNGKELHPASTDQETLTLYVSEAEIFPAEKNRIWHLLRDEIKARTNIKNVRPCVIGSPVHKGCLIAENQNPALYLGLPRKEKGVSLWDMAATASIVSGAGGHVSDIYGNLLELNRRESTYVHHRGFLYCNRRDIAEAVIAGLGNILD